MASSIQIDLTQARKKRGTAVTDLLFLLCGVCGLLSMLQGLPGVSWNAPLVYAAAVIMGAVLWYTYALGGGWFAAAFAGIVAACGLLEYRYWEVLGGQITAAVQALTAGAGAEQTDITQSMLLLAALLVLLLFLGGVWLHSSLPLAVLAVAFLLCGPLIGLQPGYVTVAMLGVALCAFLAIHGVSRRRARTLHSKDGHAFAKSGLAAAAAALLAFLLAIPLGWAGQDMVYQTVYAAEEVVQRAVQDLSNMDAMAVSDGRISRGNLYPTGAVQMQLVAYRPPTQPLYLRGFAGADYSDGEWSEAASQTLSDEIMNNMSYGTRIWSPAGINLYNMYFNLNAVSTDTEPHFITIQPSEAFNSGSYVEPYYSSFSENWFAETGYSFRYYQQDEMQVDWNAIDEQSGWLRVAMQRMQKAYQQAVQTLYTAVPDGQLPRLSALCAAQPQQGVDEATAFILQTLHSYASYSTTPGLAPLNEDIVEYFLFENREGYCVHFAAAATLMYRMFGIPARYASGYVVQPEDFQQGEDDLYYAEVTDEAAHAWTELFIEDQGWTPVEVTPAAQESVDAAGEDGVSSDSAQTETTAPDEGQNTDALDSTGQDTEQTETPSAPEGESAQPAARWGIAAACVLSGIAVLILACILLIWQRRWRLRCVYRGGCRVIFDRLLGLLWYGGRLQGCTGHEPDFAARLCEAVPDIRPEDAMHLSEIVSRAAFGSRPAGRSDHLFVWQVYSQAAAACFRGLGPLRKLVFRYIRAYG